MEIISTRMQVGTESLRPSSAISFHSWEHERYTWCKILLHNEGNEHYLNHCLETLTLHLACC